MAASPTDNSKETKKADTKANPDVHKPGSDQTAGASHAKTATKLLESNTVADTRATLKADLDRKNAEHSAVGGLHVASANGDTVTLNSKGQVDKVERAGGKASLDIGYQNGKPSTIKDKDGVWQSTDGVNFTLNGHHKTLEVNKSNFNVDFKDATANDNGKARPPEPAAKQADTRAAGQPQPNGKKPPEHSQWLDMGKSIFAGAANELNKIAHKIEGEVEAPKTAAPPEQAVKPGAGRTDNPTRPKPAEQPTPPGSKPSDQPGKPAPEVATPSTPVPPTLDAATLEKTAQDLHDALNKKEWFGLKNAPDKDKINSLLEPLSQTDRAALAQVYHKDFDEKGPPDTLMNALKDKLGGDGSVDFRKAEAVMNRQDGRTNDAGALMVAITDAQQDKEKGNAEIRAVFETLNSKQIGQMSQDFQNKYGKSYQDALKGAQLTDATQAALPILEKGVDLKDANDVKSLANIAVDKQDPHLLAEALRGDSPAATQARKDLQNDQTFKNKLADAFPSDASVNLQENGMDPKSLPFESRTDQVAQDYLNEGNISLATIASQNTGKWIFDNKDNLALAAKNATDKERQDFSLGREIADGTKTNDGTPASKEAVDYYDKIHAAFKAGGNDREVSTWEDSLINGRSTIVTDLANTHSDGWGPLGFGKGEKPQDILSKAENLSQADYNLLKDPTKGPEFRKELQDSLNTYADPGDAKRVMSLIDQKVAAPDYASAEKIHRSLEDTISDNKGHVFLGMGTSYDGNNITKNITTLSPADAQQYKSDPAFRKTVDDFVSKNLSGDDQLLAQRVLANVAQDGKPPTLDQTDTFLQDRTNGADPTKQLQDAEAAMKADPTLQARLSKPDGQLSAADQQLKSDMQDAASSAYYKQNPQPYEGEYGSPETDKFDQVSTDLFSKGGLTLQDKLDLGYSTNSLIPDIAKAPAQERTQLMSSLMPQEQQVVNAIAANNGQETLADKMRLYVTGGEGNYADFKADLAKLDPAGVQALKNDYAAKYNGDLDNDYLAKVDSKDRSQYESLLTPTASDGRQTFYDNLQKQLSDSGASMDGTAATMQRSVDQTASSLEQYQRVYQTLPKEKQQALDQYFNDSLEGRQQSKEKLAEIATTAVITAAALAAAPFTAGTSVALVASLAFAAGAATKTVMTAAIEGNDFQWTPENLAKNVVEGGVSAALNFVGAGGGVGALEGIGTKVAGDVVKDVAVDSLRDGGEKVLQDGVTQLIAKGGTEVTEAQVAALAERVAATGASAEEKAAVAASIERAVAAHATDITALSSKVGQSALQALGKEVLTSSAIGGSANAASTLAAAPFNSNGLNVNELVTSTLTGMAMGAVMPIGLHAFMGARQLVAGVSRETTTIDGVTKDVAMIHPPKAGDPAFVIHRGDTEIHMDAGSQPVQLQEGDTFKAADTGAPITQSSATVDSSLPVGAGRPAGAPNAVESVNPAETPTSAENVKPVEVAKPGEPGPEAQITAMPENLGAVAEKAQVTDVSVANLTDTKQITDSIHQGIADMHAGKPVTFHIDDTVQVPQLNDKGEVIMDGDKPKMISQGQLLYNELAKDMPDRDFNFAKGGADFTAVKPDADVRVSTKESTLALNKPVDVTTVDGATTNLPVGTKFSNGTILDGDKIRSADPNGEVWAQTPDGQLHQLTSDKVAETTIPGTAIDNGNIVAGKDTLVLSDKNGVTVKGTDGADVQLKQGTRLSNGATVDAEGRITTTDPSGKIYAVSPDGTRTELAAGTTINPTSLDHGQNLLVRIGFGDSVMNKQDDFINFDQTLKDNNQSLGNGRFAPNAGAMRDHFDLPDNVNVEANTAYGMQDIKGTEHYLMPNGFGNAGENVVLNYRGIPKDASGNFDLNSAKRLLKEFDDNHLAPPQALLDAVHVAEKPPVTDVSVANLTDTKQITDSIHQGIADMHAGKPVTFHIDDTVQVPQLNDKGEVIMDGDKPKMISQGQLLYNELAKDMPDRDFNFAKGGADFTAVKPDADVRVSTKESTLALNKPVDVTTVDGATTNLPVGTKFSNGTILDGDKIRSADPNGEVWAQTPDGQLHQLTSDKVAETTIPGTAIDNGNIVAGKDTLVLSDKNGVTVKGTDGADVQLKQGTRLSNGATVDAEGRITTTDPSGKIYAVSPDGTRTELAAGTTINPTSLDHGQNLLVRIGFGDSVMNKQDDFINFDQTLKDNNQSLGNGRFAPNAGAMRDHFDLPDNVNVEANTAYGMQDIKGTEHYLMPNGFGNAGENVVLNYRGIPKDASGNFDLNSARRLLKEFKDNHLDAPRPLVDAVNDGNVKELAAMGPPSKDLKFAGVYDGPIGREEATQINQIQAAQQKLFNDSVDTILEGTATDAAKLDQLRGIAFSDAAKDMPPNNLMKLYTAFRDKGDTEDMLRLYETTPNQDFKNSPFVREYLAAAYNKKGLAGKSLDVVKSLEQDAQTRPELMNGEVYGAAAKAHVIRREKAEALLGAVQSGDMAKIAAARDEYAKAYDLQPGESLPDAGQLKAQSQTELLAARDAYTKGFHVNYEYYPGINAVWSSLALGDLKNATNLAEITQLATVREGGLERNNYWTSMTMLESSLVGGASNADIDATIGKIVGGNKINQPDLRSTLNAWDSRVRPALQKLQSDPIQGAEATSMLERFDYAEKKLNEAVENPNSIQKATQVSTTADALRERSHSYRGQSVYDAEIVKNNFQYGGIITDTSIARRDRLEFGKLLNAPLGDLMATFGGDVSKMPGVTADMRLTDIKDPEQFVAVAQQLVRQNFGTAAKNLEIIDSLEHKLYYDHPIESLNKASGIPADRIARQGYDSRTSLSAEWAKGLGDCRHHAQSMQLLYDMWQGGRLNGFLRQAETAATPEARAAAIGSFKDLERTQLRTLDVMVNAPIKVKGAYEPIRPDTDTSLPAKLSFIADDSVNYIEDHTMNILTRSDEQGHVESARYADSFYNNTYNWSNGPIKLQQAADGSITFPGGDLDGVLGMAGNKAPVTMQFAPYSGTRTKTAANDIGDIYERGLRVDNFDIMDVMKRRAYIESQLMALTPTD
jgi:hypothetical protein